MIASPSVLARRTVLSAITFLVTVVSAHATILEPKGGPGGGPYTLECPTGWYVVGFAAKAGAWVDAVTVLCQKYIASTGRLGDRRVRFPKHAGGAGISGALQEVYCPPGDPMIGVGLAHTRGGGLERQYVNTIDLFCESTNMNAKADRCISTGEGCGYIPSKVVGGVIQTVGEYKYDQLKCPPEERVQGIHGGAGAFVDSIGLICAPLATRPPPAAKSSPRPVRVTGRPKDGAATKSTRPPIQYGVEMPGKNYREVSTRVWGDCQDLCERETPCKSWSWVASGVRGPRPMCMLKNDVPAAVKNAKAASGLKASSGVR
jgi:hypothetical protein